MMKPANRAIWSVLAKCVWLTFCLRRTALFGLAGILVTAGCGNQNGLVEVSGTVTLDGVPLEAGRIEFFPESGRPAGGEINSEGRYTLTTFAHGDGTKPGKYVVTVTARQSSEDEPMYQSLEDELNGVRADDGGQKSPGDGRVKWLAPPKYSNRASTDLTVEVTPSGGEIDIQLTSKP